MGQERHLVRDRRREKAGALEAGIPLLSDQVVPASLDALKGQAVPQGAALPLPRAASEGKLGLREVTVNSVRQGRTCTENQLINSRNCTENQIILI